MKIVTQITTLSALLVMSSTSLFGIINLFNPLIDRPIRPYVLPDYTAETLQFFYAGEFGLGAASAWNSEGKAQSPLSIWDKEQRCLQMLEGFSPTAPATQELTLVDANNAGTRGNVCINADLHLDVAGMVVARYFFLNELAISIGLPFYRYRLNNLKTVDLTPNETPLSPQDFRVRQFLTQPIRSVVQNVGCFELCEWERTGVGDLMILFDWERVFPQAKQFLRSVLVAARVGVTAPTGKQTDQDLVFAFPFGYDGSWSIPFGFSLETLFACYVYAGFDVQLTQIFGHSSFQRIHTAHNQTDLMLMQKAEMYRDPGLEQQYSIYAGLRDLPEGLNIRAIYQYRKRNDDTLSALGNCVNSVIAGEAVSLLDSTLHMAIVRIDYDFSVLMDEPCVAPQLEVFARIPFNGKRSVGNTTLGFAITIDY